MARGHIRERGPGAWELKVYVGRDPVTGKERWRYQTVRGKKRDAQRAMTKLLGEVDTGAHTGPDAPFALLLDEWQRLKAPKWSPKTAMETRGYVRRWIAPDATERPDRHRWAPGRHRVSQITPAMLDGYYRQLVDEDLAPATVQRIHGVVRAALEQAVKWDWILRNPAARTDPIEGGSAAITPPDPAALSRLLRHLADNEPEILMLVRLAAVTGRRRGELCALRWTDVDFVNGSVLIARTLADSESDGWVERPISKNKTKFPPIALDVVTLELLGEHRARCAARLATIGVDAPTDGHVFVRYDSATDKLAPWSPDGVSRRWYRVRREVGLDSVRLHDLRHFVATTLLDRGVSLTTVAGRLGHGDGGRTTQSVYAHSVPASDRAAADLIAALLDD